VSRTAHCNLLPRGFPGATNRSLLCPVSCTGRIHAHQRPAAEPYVVENQRAVRGLECCDALNVFWNLLPVILVRGDREETVYRARNVAETRFTGVISDMFYPFLYGPLPS